MGNQEILPNQDLRDYAKQKGVKMWRIANAEGITSSHLSVRLRCDMTEAQRQSYREIVDKLAAERN